MSKRKNKTRKGTLAALLEEKPKRGRPKRAIARQSVYVALSEEQKDVLTRLAAKMPPGCSRADVPDVAISLLGARLDVLRSAVADRARELPEGITDIESLYYLWDLPLPAEAPTKWTSIRLSPQQSVDINRIHGVFKALFGANRSHVFALALNLLSAHLDGPGLPDNLGDVEAVTEHIRAQYRPGRGE